MRTLLAGGVVWDGTDDAPRSNDLLIEDGIILAVGPNLDGDTVIDVTGLTLLPGLFDCHVHVTINSPELLGYLRTSPSYRHYQAARNLEKTLEAGVTTVRDAAGADAGVRNAVRDGLINGPRMQVAIDMISQTGGHGDHHMPCGMASPVHFGVLADGPDEVRRAVRRVIRSGADVIKVATSGGVMSPDDDPQRPQFQPEELAVIAAEARSAGLSIMAHAQGTDGIKNAIRAGARSIEHGIYLDDEAIQMMLDNGVFLVPTLLAPLAVLDAVAAGAQIPAESAAKAAEVVEVHRDSFRRAAAAGVRIAMGTDSGVGPHGQNLRELHLMQQLGPSPAAALRSATREAADLMGLGDKLGELAPGKIADIVAIEGDAFDLAALPAAVRTVWRDGNIVASRQPLSRRF
ncbi:amidohydrolase family protein [Marmoricola sp. RAF53]|uniref:metal-dependent hydrolase family protein n=1 Tax=Marmoricola sp. RAF53 TaxID=3233059 RepID=UPI003F9CCAB5